MTRAATSSPARRRSRAASGWRWAVVVAMGCAAPLASAQPPQRSGESAVGGGTAFVSFMAGTADAAAFAASVRSGGGVSCPSYGGEQPFESDGPLRRAARLLHTVLPDSAGCGPPGPLSVRLDSAYADFRGDVERLAASDPVLTRGELTILAAEGDVVAFQRQLGDDRRVIVSNRADAERFLPLPETGAVPGPLTPVFASWGSVEAVPALVAVVDETRGQVVYGLRIPPRTVVVFRPVEPRDVRPGGLDE